MAQVAGFFGMNLHSGLESSPPQLLWLVAGGTATASALLFVGLLLGVRRFNAEQSRQLSRTTSLEHALAGLDDAYYALRESGALDGTVDLSRDAPPLISKAALGDALGAAGAPPLAPPELDELWALLDTNADGVLNPEEVRVPLPSRGRGGRAP